MELSTEQIEKLNEITITAGAHPTPQSGYCVMEAIAWVACKGGG